MLSAVNIWMFRVLLPLADCM